MLTLTPSPAVPSPTTALPIPGRHAMPTRSSTSSSSIVSSVTSTASTVLLNDPTIWGGEDDGHVDRQRGLRHADGIQLDARKHARPSFQRKLLTLLRDELAVDGWTDPDLDPNMIRVKPITGAMTNSIFFVSSPTSPQVLLRIYGPSSTLLISRPKELHILHTLSRHYSIGPRIYGTFANGRVEQWFASRPLTKEELRVGELKDGIAKRMRELHGVDLRRILLPGDSALDGGIEDELKSPLLEPQRPDSPAPTDFSLSSVETPASASTPSLAPPMPAVSPTITPGVWANLASWMAPAAAVLAMLKRVNLPADHPYASIVKDVDLSRFKRELARYVTFVEEWEEREGESPIVFCHNDTQYGNLLLLDHRPPAPAPPHHQLCVIDFEYAAANPRAYDIGNHFNEWRYDYHHPTHSWAPLLSYPSPAERRSFYASYLSLHPTSPHAAPAPDRLEAEVRVWAPASMAMWGVWGLVQARDQVLKLAREFGADLPVATEEAEREREGSDGEAEGEPGSAGGVEEFEYLKYARAKFEAFREATGELGL